MSTSLPHRRRRLVATALVTALLGTGLGACTASGSDGSADDTTTSTGTGTGGGGAGDPGAAGPDEEATGEQGPDPSIDDVPDETFDGLGDPRIDVVSYDVVVAAEPDVEEISGQVTIVLSATTDEPLASFTLDLRGPEIEEATVDGEEAEIREAGEAEVAIEPSTPLLPAVEVEVVLTYAGVPDQTTFPALGVPVGWQQDDAGGWFTMSEPDGTSTWVPVSDHPSDKAVWSITLDTPKGVTGVSNGHLVSKDTAKGRTRWVWEAEEPMASYLAFAAVGAYDLVERDGPDGIALTFAFPPTVSEMDREAFDATDDALEYLAETFGPYPFADSGAVVVDRDLGLALEVQTRPLYGTDSVGYPTVSALVHELAHQWFGDDVSPAAWPELWLNEGFATYADWLYLDHTGEVDLDDLVGRAASGDSTLAVTDPVAAATFDQVVYRQGAVALHALRLEVGDDAFFATMRRWVQERAGSTGTTEQFTAIAADEAGQDLDDFFTAWLDEAPQPDLPD